VVSTADISRVVTDPLNVSEAEMEALLRTVDDDNVVKDGPAEKTPAPVKAEEPKADLPIKPEVQPEQPADILTRDGKHTIPYSVLEAERRKAGTLEQTLQQERTQRESMERAVEDLRSQLQAAKAAPKTDEALVQINQDIEAIREEFPALGNFLDAMTAQVAKLQEDVQVANRRADTASQVAARASATQSETLVEEAISNNPKLLYARAVAPEAFNAIADIDTWMRGQPQFAQLSLGDRFTKAVAMYEAANGAIQVPVNASPAQKTTQQAAAPSGVPNTLSDMPGGAIPPKSASEALLDKNGAELTQMMMGMTPEAIERLLAQTSI
jgi:hypothetical protein